MVDKRISELPELNSGDVAGGDWIVVTDSSTNTSKKLDFGDYKLTQSATDTTAGRLLTTGAGVQQAYRAGNAVGNVADGALIEEGENANGSYTIIKTGPLKGTMICTIVGFDLDYNTGSSCQSDWDFPVGFSSTPAISAIVNASATIGNITPDLDELQAVTWSNSGDNSNKVRVIVRRVKGGTDFQSGDVVKLFSVTAIGEYE